MKVSDSDLIEKLKEMQSEHYFEVSTIKNSHPTLYEKLIDAGVSETEIVFIEQQEKNTITHKDIR